MVDSRRELGEDQPITRFAQALHLSGFASGDVVLNGFSAAYPGFAAMAQAALEDMGCRAFSALELLADDSLVATHFVGSPDRFFTLCQAGYHGVMTHGLLAGGAVFPVIHQAAAQHDITLADLMADETFGPYAIRLGPQASYAILDGVEGGIFRPGSEHELEAGLVGEVVLLWPDGGEHRTGILSALEQVPHKQRAPGLQGWMGLVEHQALIDQRTMLENGSIAALLAAHDELLGARLVLGPGDPAAITLQVETEAGPWIEADLAEAFQARTGLAAIIERVTPGTLPNTGRSFIRRAAA